MIIQSSKTGKVILDESKDFGLVRAMAKVRQAWRSSWGFPRHLEAIMCTVRELQPETVDAWLIGWKDGGLVVDVDVALAVAVALEIR